MRIDEFETRVLGDPVGRFEIGDSPDPSQWDAETRKNFRLVITTRDPEAGDHDPERFGFECPVSSLEFALQPSHRTPFPWRLHTDLSSDFLAEATIGFEDRFPHSRAAALCRYFGDRYSRRWHSEWIGREFLRSTLNDPVFIRTDNGALAGFVTLKASDNHTMRINLLACWPGRGIGSQLMEGAIHHAGSRGMELRVRTQISNIPAIRLYQKFGFKPVEAFTTWHWIRP